MRKIITIKLMFILHATRVIFLEDCFWMFNEKGNVRFSTGNNNI
jgi:hypothetical protein